jgi:hypothetical protein
MGRRQQPPQLQHSTKRDRLRKRGGRIEASRRTSATTIALLLLLALGLVCAPAAGAASRTPLFGLSWLAPSPADGKSFTVSVGDTLSVSLVAGNGATTTRIEGRRLPLGAALASTPGRPGSAVLTWTPTAAQLGTHVFVFVGASLSGAVVTQPRALFVQVIAGTVPGPNDVTPIGTNGISRWAYIARPAVAHANPTLDSHALTRLSTITPDDTQNLVQVLARVKDAGGRIWYLVRLAILPNDSTGWVLSGALTSFRGVSTYLVVDRQLFTATLYRRGVPIFRTRIGVGKPYWPTPAGDYYVREVFTNFNDPFYGPVAFGTSARSAVLTDWPGGGFIGIHGTNQPQILPGRVSHGCIRVRNGQILRLLGLMPVGTPVAIR